MNHLKPLFDGDPICWGARPEWVTLPIVNLPVDTMKVRRRIRSFSVAKAYVKTMTGVQEWSLAPCDGGLRLLHQTAINKMERTQQRGEQATKPKPVAEYRIRPSWIGDSGVVYYKVQQRRWWGWATMQGSLHLGEARSAIEDLLAFQNAK
jgi:hypothetical protein